MPKIPLATESSTRAAGSGNAQSESARRSLREINASAMALLIECAQNCVAHEPEFALHSVPRRTLRALTPDAIERLAALPVLLVDLEFQNAPWWREQSRRRHLAVRACSPRSAHRAALQVLTRAVIADAWIVCQQDPIGARLRLGVIDAVIEPLLTLGPVHWSSVAERAWTHLHPRWREREHVWPQLIEQAQSPRESPLARLACLQQLAPRALTPST